jgi:hypothetical protein
LFSRDYGPTDANWQQEEPVDEVKPFDIPKREVWEAFKKVKGAAGVDGQTIADFEADEPGREGTLQHAAEIKLCAGYCNPNWVAAVSQWVTTPACHLRRPGQVPGPLASVGGSGR